MQFAGHSNPSVTKRWYIDPRLAEHGPRPHELLPRLDPPGTGDERHTVDLPGLNLDDWSNQSAVFGNAEAEIPSQNRLEEIHHG